MPLVHIDLMQGRTPDQLASMVRAVSEAIASSLDAPIGTVRIVISEMQEHQYSVGGRPWTEVVAERRSEGAPGHGTPSE